MKERQSFNKTGQRGHCRMKERNNKKEGSEGGGPPEDEERGGQKGLGCLRESTGMEGVREGVNRGESKSFSGLGGREMAAMNK